MHPVRAQGWYYLLGGLWPLVHLRSFAAVAGPKPDAFQTHVTSALFAATGAALLRGTRHGAPDPVTRVLAAGAAAGVGLVSLRYRRSIRPVLLADAALEAVFAAAALRAPD